MQPANENCAQLQSVGGLAIADSGVKDNSIFFDFIDALARYNADIDHMEAMKAAANDNSR